MKCAVYVRVSTEEQAKEGYSLAAQTDKIVEYIKSKGWTYSQIYNDDGYSAASRRRPALQRLLADAASQQFEAVIVYRIDRLSRNLKDLIEIVEELATNGAGFKSITEIIDTTTPEGRLMFHQFGSFAQYERELISQRTSLGRSKRLKLGLWPGGRAPFGYLLKAGKLQTVEKEAKLVRLMFELYLNKNLGVINIARYLNDKGIKTKQGKKWKFTVVHKILTNPTYTGCIVRSGERVTGAHKPIIKEEVFNKVREVLPTRKAKTRSLVSPNLFTGYIFCGCGSAMHMMYPGLPNKARYKYYACSRRVTYKDCKQDYLRADILEESVIDQLEKIAEDKTRLQAIITNLKKENNKLLPSLKNNQQKLSRKIAMLSKEKEGLLRWMSQKAAKPYTLNVLNERFEKIELELNELTHSRWQVEEELKKRLHFGLSPEKVSLYLKKVVATFAELERQEQKRLLLEVIQKIKVNSLDEVHLYLSLPRKISILDLGQGPLGSTLY
ncbi:MAG TPA: recombinase family protein [Candidatus Omnitrophota bacterium]|nr:recombinase family protein [Candidatus Omnitrophota bacterium]HQJ15530.1 recombinase family protein [Candidatus Omnitrophota bacterium]